MVPVRVVRRRTRAVVACSAVVASGRRVGVVLRRILIVRIVIGSTVTVARSVVRRRIGIVTIGSEVISGGRVRVSVITSRRSAVVEICVISINGRVGVCAVTIYASVRSVGIIIMNRRHVEVDRGECLDGDCAVRAARNGASLI